MSEADTKQRCANCGRTSGPRVWCDGQWWCPGACHITKKYPGSVDGRGGGL